MLYGSLIAPTAKVRVSLDRDTLFILYVRVCCVVYAACFTLPRCCEFRASRNLANNAVCQGEVPLVVSVHYCRYEGETSTLYSEPGVAPVLLRKAQS